MKHKQSGFTLVELLVVIAIISILSTIGVVSFQGAQRAARDAQRKNDLKVVQYALTEYSQDNPSAGYPGPAGATAIARFTNVLTTLSPYLGGRTPRDPRNGTGTYGYGYTQTGSGSGFQLTACLENSNEPLVTGYVVSTSTSTCSSARQLQVNNP